MYTEFMADKTPIQLTKKVIEPIPGMNVNKSWKPNTESQTFTMPYGGQAPKMVDVQKDNK